MTTFSPPASHVVGIGAAAGGPQALEQFFANLSALPGMAVIVLQPLSADFASRLEQRLTRHTSMSLRRITDRMPMAPEAVYILPPRHHVVIGHGLLRLVQYNDAGHGLYLPIDTFFICLATALGEKAIGIVLSGTGSDGTHGIRAIKAAGGLVMVQRPDTAQYDGMPRHALGTGLADYVLAPADMPDALRTHAQGASPLLPIRHTTRAAQPAMDAEPPPAPAEMVAAEAERPRSSAADERARQDLAAVTADLDNVLRTIDAGVIWLDQELRLRKFSPAATTFISLQEQDVGRPVQAFAACFAPFDLSQAAQEVLHTGQPVAHELCTRAGTWLLVRLAPFLSATGTRQGVVLTCTDVTRLKLAEAAVKQSQTQLQEILDNAPAAIYIKDTAGRYLLVDRQYEALLHLPSAQFLGKTVYDLYPREVAETLAAHDRQVLAANAPLTFEETGAASAEGPRTFVSVKFPLRDATGAPYALCGISTDITQRKRAEEALYHAKVDLEHRVQELSRLATILEATTDVVGIADTRQHLVYLNAAGRKILGIGTNAVTSLTVANFVPGWAMQIIREIGVPTAIRDGTWTGETALLSPDGREIPVSQVIIAHTTAHGTLSAFSTIMRDITAEKQARDLLRHRAEEMEAFAYSASHDLQAPLRTFEGYARWLLEDYSEVLGDTGRQLCGEIIVDAVHMKTLLDGLLEYSRIGRQHVESALVEVKTVLEWVLHDLQLDILNSRATVYLPDNLPTVVYPEAHLTQVFTNLLSNALKFVAPGQASEVTIDWQEEARFYRLSIRDNGIGIAPEHFTRIFEIFRRLHTREVYPGTGAGLTIVKKIVESHGGQIGVESTPGAGSTFWFTIPRLAPPCPAA